MIEHFDRIARRHLIEHEGRIMCWREFGGGPATAPPLVLLHGGHGTWLHWLRNIDALASAQRLLVPDLPGYGESDALPLDAGLEGLVDMVGATLDQLVGENTAFDLAGFSFGGVVAGCLAAQRGGVRRLALLGAVGHGKRRRQSGGLLGWQDAADEQAIRATMRHNLGVLMLHGPIDDLALDIHHRSCIRTRYVSKKISLSPVLTHALARLDMPVLMLWGEHDTTGDPHEVGPLWQADRPERAYEVIAGAGHWVQYEAAIEVNRRLADWFRHEPG
jgi:pimeloyl-ACP methyl ester carboxylesterase